MVSGSPRLESSPSRSAERRGHLRSVPSTQPGGEQVFPTMVRMARQSARRDAPLYTWSELPAAKRQATLELVRESERKRRRARRRSVLVTILLVVLIVAFVVVVLGQLTVFSP